MATDENTQEAGCKHCCDLCAWCRDDKAAWEQQIGFWIRVIETACARAVRLRPHRISPEDWDHVPIHEMQVEESALREALEWLARNGVLVQAYEFPHGWQSKGK